MHLEKDNLVIRDARAEDAALLCGWWNDGVVMAHAGFPNGLDTTPEKIAASLAGDTDASRRLIIELDGKPIGEMSYSDEGGGVAGIGIKICDFSKQEQGHGTKYLCMLIDELFSGLGFQKIILDTNLNNTRAQHVYEKIGFIKTAVHMNSWRNQLGELQSRVDYELLRSAFYQKYHP